jgi:hypothetical protein
MLFNDTEDASMALPSFTAQVYSGFISEDSSLPSCEHTLIDIDGSDDGAKPDPHKKIAEEELSMLSNTHGCQITDKHCL